MTKVDLLVHASVSDNLELLKLCPVNNLLTPGRMIFEIATSATPSVQLQYPFLTPGQMSVKLETRMSAPSPRAAAGATTAATATSVSHHKISTAHRQVVFGG